MSDTRSEIGKALEGRLSPEQISLLLDEVLAIRKKAWGDFECKNCGQRQRQQTEIADAASVTKALVDLANQAWGRPNEVAKEQGDFIVNRNVYLVDEPED